jgi:hypothetical protein
VLQVGDVQARANRGHNAPLLVADRGGRGQQHAARPVAAHHADLLVLDNVALAQRAHDLDLFERIRAAVRPQQRQPAQILKAAAHRLRGHSQSTRHLRTAEQQPPRRGLDDEDTGRHLTNHGLQKGALLFQLRRALAHTRFQLFVGAAQRVLGPATLQLARRARREHLQRGLDNRQILHGMPEQHHD